MDWRDNSCRSCTNLLLCISPHLQQTIVLGKLNPKMHICWLAVEKDRPADLDTTSRSYPSRLRIRSTKNRTAKYSRPCNFARMKVFASTLTRLKNIKRGRDASGILKIPMPTLPTKSEDASSKHIAITFKVNMHPHLPRHHC